MCVPSQFFLISSVDLQIISLFVDQKVCVYSTRNFSTHKTKTYFFNKIDCIKFLINLLIIMTS